MRADAAAFTAATGYARIEAVAVGRISTPKMKADAAAFTAATGSRKKHKVELEPGRISTPRMRADVAAFTVATGLVRIE